MAKVITATPPKKKYKNNYLVNVIYQIAFNPIENISNDTLKKYKDLLGEKYTDLSDIKQQGIIIQNDGSNIRTETEEKSVWQIQSSNGDHIIEITQESFSVIFSKYNNFKEYKDIVSNAQNSFLKLFESVQQINRLGLRYVNKVNLDEPNVDWANYINPSLIGSFNFTEIENIRRSMHSIVLSYDEETHINLNYGVYNNYFPAPISDNEFIVDTDAFTPFATEVDQCERLLEKFNTVIAIYFEKSITQKLRDKMGELSDDK